MALNSPSKHTDSILKAVARTLPEPVFVLDEDGTYVEVIGGTSRDKYDDPSGLVGKSIRDVMDKKHADWFIEWIHKALDRGETLTHEYALGSHDVDNPKSGTGPSGMQWFEASVVPLGMEHEGRRLVAWIAYNATERHEMLVRLERQRKQLEKQKSELQELALTDYLTDVPNRRHFLSIFDHEFRKVSTGRASELALIILDLDHFKRINDTKGHAAGDQALKTIAELLCASMRDSDVVARLGGEEFGILLPGTNLDDAAEIADKIVVRVDETLIRITGGVIRVTASLGVAAYRSHDKDQYELMKRADEALYEAKAGGRNRWCKSA